MMTALLLYGYCCGIYSSRRIAKACRERVDFMSIVALDAPDFRTICEFRKRHLEALSGLFVQVLKLCEKAGLVKLGHAAFDGTKIKANTSKHKAMPYERMEARATQLDAEVAKWLAAADAADSEEDKLYGSDKQGDEMPDWVADKKAGGDEFLGSPPGSATLSIKCSSGRLPSPKLSWRFFVSSMRLVTVLWGRTVYAALR
jgi:Transposase domain (DUF772)